MISFAFQGECPARRLAHPGLLDACQRGVLGLSAAVCLERPATLLLQRPLGRPGHDSLRVGALRMQAVSARAAPALRLWCPQLCALTALDWRAGWSTDSLIRTGLALCWAWLRRRALCCVCLRRPEEAADWLAERPLPAAACARPRRRHRAKLAPLRPPA